ncbi:MAG: hypothetical protein HQK84_07960 [Nitrospinae bacterium]|nr:hypothetical protein [Nitrospinota bacterium]
MDKQHPYNIFIGHAWHHRGVYGRVLQMLYDAPYFYWKNCSNPHKGVYGLFISGILKKKIVDQIAPANIVIMSTDVYNEKPDWGSFEIREAVRQGKPIITLESHEKNVAVPEVLAENSNVVIPINEFRLVAAINDHVRLTV